MLNVFCTAPATSLVYLIPKEKQLPPQPLKPRRVRTWESNHEKETLLAVLRNFRRDNAEKYGILEIGVFGSTARDEAGEKNDVDIFIKTNTPNPFNLVHIKEDKLRSAGRNMPCGDRPSIKQPSYLIL